MTKLAQRPTNNPYIEVLLAQETDKFSVLSELKRLLGGWRWLLTILFIVVPLSLSLAGGIDLLGAKLYTVAKHVKSDERERVILVKCLFRKPELNCREVASPLSLKGTRKYQLWPFEQSSDYLLVTLAVTALLAYTAIGNRRTKLLLTSLKVAFGISQVNSNTPKNFQKLALSPVKKLPTPKLVAGENLPIPLLEFDPDGEKAVFESNVILGGYQKRAWASAPGYFYFDHNQPVTPYWLSLDLLKTNLLVVAPPGSGKTASVFRPLVEFMRRSNSVALVFDAKGNDFDPADFDLNLDLNNPSLSFKLNLYSGATPEQAGERLAEALIPNLENEQAYFANNAKDALAFLVAAHHGLFSVYPTPTELLHYLTSSDLLTKLQARLARELPNNPHLIAILKRLLQLNANAKNDVLGLLATMLIPLTYPPASDLLVANPAPDAYTLTELLQKPGLVRVALPVADHPRLAGIIGRLVLAQFTYAVLSPSANRNLYKLAAVDEARHFLTEALANGMAQARSNNAGYALSFQSLAQIKDESLRDTIFAAAGTKIVLAGVGDKDAERFSKIFGQLELPYAQPTTGETTATGATKTGNRPATTWLTAAPKNTSGSQSRGSTSNRTLSRSQATPLKLRARFLPAEIRELAQYQAIVESSDAQGQRWFAQVLDLNQQTVAALQTEVNALLEKPKPKSRKKRK